MLTRQSPALLDGFRQISSDDQAAQMLQAFANCNASLSHRGPVSLSNPQFPNQGGVMRPYGNGGGTSGVSRAGPSGGPGQMLKGGVYVPDPTQRLPPWGLQPGVGSGMTYPARNYYGGNYYGADSFGRDYGTGAPSGAYLQHIDTGGDYYDNSSYYGGGGYQNQYFIGGEVSNAFYVTNSGGDYYAGDWHTAINDNSVNIAGPNISNTSNYTFGGNTLTIMGDTIFEGDTTINNYYGSGVAVGPAGPPGPPGDPGAPGGEGGGDVIIFGPPGQPGAGGVPRKINVVTGVRSDRGQAVTQVKTIEKIVVVGVSFDPETCELNVEFDTVRAVFGDPVTAQFVKTVTADRQNVNYLAPR